MFSFMALIFAAQPAQAKFNPNNQIHVYGRVVSTHHIIIGEAGNISYIVSNAQDAVPPQKIYVYKDRISNDTLTEITPEIKVQYLNAISSLSIDDFKVGTIYENPHATSSSFLEEVSELSGRVSISIVNRIL